MKSQHDLTNSGIRYRISDVKQSLLLIWCANLYRYQAKFPYLSSMSQEWMAGYYRLVQTLLLGEGMPYIVEQISKGEGVLIEKYL